MKKIVSIILIIIVVILLFAALKVKMIGTPIADYNLGAYFLKSDYDTTKEIQLTFLGTSGFVLNYKGKKLISDPYFSNPDVFKNFVEKLQRPPLSEEILPRNVYDNASTIIISHGHYDHCLDIETFLTKNLPTKIITEQHIANEVYSVKNYFDVIFETDMSQIHYSYDSTFRILPLHSPHSAHFAGITLFTGFYKEPLAEIPDRFWKWKLNDNYSYLVDILEDGKTKFRCLFTSGNVSEEALEILRQQCIEKKVDLVLQIFWNERECMPNLTKVYAIATPKQMILHHWNNFFKQDQLEVMHDTHLDKVLKKLNEEGKNAYILYPFSSTSFDIQ